MKTVWTDETDFYNSRPVEHLNFEEDAMIKKALLALFVVMLTVSLVSAAEKITIEAEGSGTTKMEALKAAWMEAVRNAVGMSMTGSTRLADDKITEEIATYSRGQVNSYQILSETQNNNLWQIRIRANIDRDILQETAKTTRSQTIDLTKSNDFAAALSAQEARKNGVQMFLSAWKATDWSSCVDYTCRIMNILNRLWIVHKCKINIKNYSNIADNFTKILSSIAIRERDVPIEYAVFSKQIIDIDKLFNSDKAEYNEQDLSLYLSNPKGDDYRSYVDIEAYGLSFSQKLHEIGVLTPSGNMKLYELNEQDFYKIRDGIGSFDITFSVETNDGGLGSILASRTIKMCDIVLVKDSCSFLQILPVFKHNRRSLYFNILQPLDLSDEQISNIQSITGKYTITPVTE